jgi:hypothetical protein
LLLVNKNIQALEHILGLRLLVSPQFLLLLLALAGQAGQIAHRGAAAAAENFGTKTTFL